MRRSRSITTFSDRWCCKVARWWHESVGHGVFSWRGRSMSVGAGVDGVCSPTARPQLWPPLSRQIQCAGEAKRTSHGRPGALQLATGHLPLRRPWRRCNPGAHTAHIRARRLRAQTRPRVRTRNIHLSAPWPLDSRVSSSSRTSGCGSLSASQSESPRSTWHSRIGGRP